MTGGMNVARWIDAHCDLLSAMMLKPTVEFAAEDGQADVSYSRLREGGVGLQCFAVYLPEQQGQASFGQILRQIDLFYLRIASHPGTKCVRSVEDLDEVTRGDALGVMLTLEGADGLEGDWVYLRTIYRLGVRMLGLTWNHANWAADGVMEPRGGGLTTKGKQLVMECNRLGIILDVSHLSERGFWELAELSQRPWVATHSNARRLCPHPRNLTDEQILATIRAGGMIGVTFVPWFLQDGEASVTDILRHIDHICSLGGEKAIGFGSDFDGIDRHLPELAHPGHYPRLAEELYRHYSSEQAEGFLGNNWREFFRRQLPRRTLEAL